MMRSCLLLLALLVLTVTWSTIHADGAAVVWPPQWASANYYTPNGVPQQTNYFMNIVSDNDTMSGSLVFLTASFGQNFPITGYLDGIPYYQTEIVLPHESDDMYGCKVAFHTQNEFNETFTNKTVMLFRGLGCSDGEIALRAQQMGADSGMLAQCYLADLCPPNLQAILSGQKIDIPLSHISNGDGDKIQTYLVGRRQARKAAQAQIDAGQPVTVTIPVPIYMRYIASGPMDPDELASLKLLAKNTMNNQDTVNRYPLGGLPTYNLEFASSNSSVDPCLKRMAGTWCENGHLVAIDMRSMDWTDRVPGVSGLHYIGGLLKLRILSIELNYFGGALPVSWCNLKELRHFWGSYMFPGFTSMPACYTTDLPKLQFIGLSTNQLSGPLPDFGKNAGIVFYDFGVNYLMHTIPANISTWTSLYYFDVSFNSVTSIPKMSGYNALTVYNVAKNLIVQNLTADFFDYCPTLALIRMSNNSFSGVLPNFIFCVSLVTFEINNNMITGTIPTTWGQGYNAPYLYSFSASNNRLVSPIAVLQQLPYLNDVDLSRNLLTLGPSADLGVFLPGGAKTKIINLAYNLLSGTWSETVPKSVNLTYLDISHNQIQNLPTQLAAQAWGTLDASFNNLTSWNGATVFGPIAGWSKINLQGNPKLVILPPPTWLAYGSQVLLDRTESYLCPDLSSNVAKTLQLLVDPEFTGYTQCRCNKGAFGIPPRCFAVPITSVLESLKVDVISTEVGPAFNELIDYNSGRGAKPPANTTFLVDSSLSDSWYGQNRLTQGLNTNWVIDLQNETTPIRYITIYFHISRALFVDETDTLTIYEGDSSLKSERVAIRRGTDDDLPPVSSDIWTSQKIYQQTYAKQLQSLLPPYGTLDNSTALWTVQVFGSLTTINFASRDQSGTHFFSTYRAFTDCPDGYFYDPNIQKCRVNLAIYDVSSGAQAAVYATAAFAIAVDVIMLIVVALYFQSAVIRAASRWFMILLLVFLLMLSGGSILYAVVPDAAKTSQHRADMLCQARGWMTAFPLTGILALLVAKTNRMSEIFTSAKLTLRVISDTEILITIGALLSVASVLLGVFSGIPLTFAQANEGSGSLVGYAVRECAMKDGFKPWIGVMLGFLGVLLILAIYLSFKTRNLPSRFNESQHITNAVILCLFYGSLIVPLAGFISDNPNASLLIQGIGQALGALLLTLTLFVPKTFYIFFGGDRGVFSVDTKSGQQTPGNGSDTKRSHSGTASSGSNNQGVVPQTPTASGGHGSSTAPGSPRPMPQAAKGPKADRSDRGPTASGNHATAVPRFRSPPPAASTEKSPEASISGQPGDARAGSPPLNGAASSSSPSSMDDETHDRALPAEGQPYQIELTTIPSPSSSEPVGVDSFPARRPTALDATDNTLQIVLDVDQ